MKEKGYTYTNRDIDYILDDFYFEENEKDGRVLTEEGKKLIFDCADNYLSSILSDTYDMHDFYEWTKTYEFGSFVHTFLDVRVITENIVYFYSYSNDKFNFDDIRVTYHMEEFLSAIDEIIENSKFFLDMNYKYNSDNPNISVDKIIKYRRI